MNTLKKRYTTMAVLLASIGSSAVALAVGTPNTAEAAPPYEDIGTLSIRGSINIDRRILKTSPDNVAAVVDLCEGAVVYEGGAPGTLYLAAHRTQCTNGNGFGGVETLKKGDTVTVNLTKPTRSSITYEWLADGLGDYPTKANPNPAPPAPPPIGTQLTLQTSKGTTQFYLKHFQPAGLPAPAGNRGRKVTQGRPACVAVPDADRNDWVFVNVTPVQGEGRGYVTAYPAGRNNIVADPRRAPSTSTANWTSSSASPNTTLVQAGDNGQVCAAAYGGATHILIDALAIAEPGRFTAAQRRLADTRSTGRSVSNGTECFQVPGASGKWTVFNLTAIGRTTGWGRLETPGSTRTYSNVNFRSGDVDANMVILQVPSNEQVCYRSGGTSDAVIDLIAIATDGTFRFDPRLPGRALTLTTPPADVLWYPASAFGAVNDGWVFVNETPLPRGGGVARLYDCELHPASGSDVNYSSRADPNVGVIKTGPTGDMCMATIGAQPGWVLDALAIADPDTFVTPRTRRLYDSRS